MACCLRLARSRPHLRSHPLKQNIRKRGDSKASQSFNPLHRIRVIVPSKQFFFSFFFFSLGGHAGCKICIALPVSRGAVGAGGESVPFLRRSPNPCYQPPTPSCSVPSVGSRRAGKHRGASALFSSRCDSHSDVGFGFELPLAALAARGGPLPFPPPPPAAAGPQWQQQAAVPGGRLTLPGVERASSPTAAHCRVHCMLSPPARPGPPTLTAARDAARRANARSC